MTQNVQYMQKALEIAKKSGGDLPIGAVVVCGDEIIASAHNEKEQKAESSLHAEMIAISAAQKKLKKWRLNDCTIYVTLEPCPMCAWAIIHAIFKKVCFGAPDALYGALGSAVDLRQLAKSSLAVEGGILEAECKELLSEYLKKRRETDD